MSISINLREQKGFEWSPDPEQVENANITKFINKHGLHDEEELYTRSLKEPNWFYEAIMSELDIHWSAPYTSLFDNTNGDAWTKWFLNAKTNIVENAIEKHIHNGNGDKDAFVFETEEGRSESLTYSALNQQVNEFAAGLIELGITKGDRVAIYLPLITQVPVSFYACAKIGAIVIPIFSGYGEDAVAVRLQDPKAKALITADGFYRRGKPVDLLSIAERAAAKSPSVEHVIVVNHLQSAPMRTIPLKNYEEVIKPGKSADTVLLGADEPLLILYTSGTTGKPKGTVHSHMSFAIKSAIDMYFCFDVKKDDRLFWITDFGWMMGPWILLGSGIHGITLILYEGSPDYPAADRLFSLVDKHQVSIFGLAPTVIRSLMTQSNELFTKHNLSSLRILGSTGEAWNPEAWRWYLTNIGKDRCPIINYSGGTEISGGILGSFPTKPLKPCGFHGPIPGMNASIVNDRGEETDGTIGELVLKQSFVGMTCSFWENDERYIESYWSKYSGMWAHGDLVQKDNDGIWYILGRADDTLKIAGKRVGPSEVETALSSHKNVVESAAIGVPHSIKGEAAVVFTVLYQEVKEEELQSHLISKLGKALKPEKIIAISSLPKTQSGKIARRLLKNKYLGQPLGDTSTLQNPESLEEVKSIGIEGGLLL
ncbi:AMP-binding protein [Fictibacillus aquaticus]|uniref:acetate--CoA ligase n=1 Tax=Fictibacillus aquaticus TaxID=2021314 RepID=A0A235FCD4_9BACL|nr:AMP-binding protein [Fictibacillus aquaticus]OYD58603.1 AMP-dependent synthetase [Fictibacillus aquaticus]